jgi:hypothetical protein
MKTKTEFLKWTLATLTFTYIMYGVLTAIQNL